jgi:hypothetical protein
VWRALAWSFLVAPFLALLWAATAMYVAWQHNPQEQFHGAGVVHWSEWLIIGAFNFAGAFVAALPLVALVWVSSLLVRRIRGQHDGS